MTEAEIYEKLNTIFRNQFKDDTIEVTAEMSAKDIAGWDSLAHVRLIISCEKEFGVKFRTREVSSFRNVGNMVSLVLAKKSIN